VKPDLGAAQQRRGFDAEGGVRVRGLIFLLTTNARLDPVGLADKLLDS